MITIINTELSPHIYDYEVILFPMGINNSMNSGFPYDIALNFPEVKESENQTNYGDKRKLGTSHETIVDNIIFCACYIHNGGFHKEKDGSFLDYNKLEACLVQISNKYKDKKIATIVLGSNKTDGNGNKEKILTLIENTFNNHDIVVYDYPEIDYKTKCFKEIAALHKRLVEQEINGEEYIRQRSEIEWRRRNGIFKPKPDDYIYYPKEEKKKLDFVGRIKLKK